MKEKKTEQMLIRLKPSELEQIKKNALVCHRSVSAFVIEMATYFCVYEPDFDAIVDHSHRITSIKNALNQLIFTIRKTGNYTPKDLEYILDRMDEIYKSEIELNEWFHKTEDSLRNQTHRDVRRIVKERMSKLEKEAAKKK